MKKVKGEVSLIVLLVMVMLVTIGLGVVSRSVTEITTSKLEEESQRAFSAAEAGIEEALKQSELEGWSTGDYKQLTTDGALYKAEASTTDEFFMQVDNSETAEVKLEGSVNGSLQIKWTLRNSAEENPDSSCTTGSAPAALEIVKVREEGGNIVARRLIYNPSKCILVAGVDKASNPGNSDDFLNRVTVNVKSMAGDADQFLRLKPLYNKASIKVEGGLPSQAYQIISRGKGTGGEQRAVEVIKYFPSLPTIFDYVLFSGGNISK